MTSILPARDEASSRSNGPSKLSRLDREIRVARTARLGSPSPVDGTASVARCPGRQPVLRGADGDRPGLGQSRSGRARVHGGSACRSRGSLAARSAAGEGASGDRLAATVVSGNLTVREMTVSNTLSPNASTTRGEDLAAVQRAARRTWWRGCRRALEVGVEPLLDLVDRVDEQRDAAQREELALERDDHAVGGG